MVKDASTQPFLCHMCFHVSGVLEQLRDSVLGGAAVFVVSLVETHGFLEGRELGAALFCTFPFPINAHSWITSPDHQTRKSC